jgi:hypothetical protein
MSEKIPAKRRSQKANSDEYCPLCGDDQGKCYKLWGQLPRDGEGTGELGYFCLSKTAQHCDYENKGECRNSRWTYYSKISAWGDRTSKERLAEMAEARLRERQERAKLMLPVPSRNQWLHKLIECLELSPADRADLERRGLSPEDIQHGLFRSVAQQQPLPMRFPPNLPGVDPVSQQRLLTSGSGYLVPIVNVYEMLVGCQIRLNSPDINDRYRWLSSSWQAANGGQGQQTPNGETPLTVRRPLGDYDPSVIGFCEGLGVKPYSTAIKLRQTVIGTSGAFWCASPQTLKGSLDILNASKFELHPDAGMILNESILIGYKSLIDVLEEMNKPVTISWWGQAHKTNHDIDELPDFSNVVRLTPRDYWNEVSEAAKPSYMAMAEAEGSKPIKGHPIEVARDYKRLQSSRKLRQLKISSIRAMYRLNLSWGDPLILGWMERNRTSQEMVLRNLGPQTAFYRFLSQQEQQRAS